MASAGSSGSWTWHVAGSCEPHWSASSGWRAPWRAQQASPCCSPTPQIALTPEYLRLLESLAAAASDSGQLAGGALRDLPVRVQASSGSGDAGSAAQDASRLSADEALGVVIVSVDASAREVLAYLQVRHCSAVQQRFCEAYAWPVELTMAIAAQGCMACGRQ